jgi:hypothetical protein
MGARAALTFLLLLASATLAAGMATRVVQADGSPAVLVVSTFDSEESAPPGATLSRTIRVSNRGADPLTVNLAPREVELLDDGQTRFGDTPDPLWASALTVSTPQTTVGPGSWQDVTVRVAIPPDMPPDDYITGVLVAPVPPPASPVLVVNAIGALVPIAVSGDRVRTLELVSHSLPLVVIGDSVSGSVRVRDTGTTLVSPWLEANIVDELTASQVASIRVSDPARIGPGASRDLAYTWSAGLTAGKFRVPVHVFYNHDNSTTAQIDVEEELWLVHPALLAIPGLVLLGAVGGGLLLVRRKRGYLWPRRTSTPHVA